MTGCLGVRFLCTPLIARVLSWEVCMMASVEEKKKRKKKSRQEGQWRSVANVSRVD